MQRNDYTLIFLVLAVGTLAACAGGTWVQPAGSPGRQAGLPYALVAPGTSGSPVISATKNRDRGLRVAGPLGQVQLTIRWPERMAFTTQTIPDSANSLEIQISDSRGNLLAYDLITRPSQGALVTSATMSVAAGTARAITVDAFQAQTPGLGDVPIAQGTASLDVAPSSICAAAVNLVPTAIPTVQGMTPANAGPGTFVTLDGLNFSGNGGPVYVIFGGGATASTPISATSTAVEVSVPSTAITGPISVWADGVPGTPGSGSFSVLSRFQVTPATAAASVSTAVTFAAAGIDTSGQTVADTAVNWTCWLVNGPTDPLASPPPASTLSAGVFTPGATGTYQVQVSSGMAIGTASVTVD